LFFTEETEPETLEVRQHLCTEQCIEQLVPNGKAFDTLSRYSIQISAESTITRLRCSLIFYSPFRQVPERYLKLNINRFLSRFVPIYYHSISEPYTILNYCTTEISSICKFTYLSFRSLFRFSLFFFYCSVGNRLFHWNSFSGFLLSACTSYYVGF
jgi:hypothetical protein